MGGVNGRRGKRQEGRRRTSADIAGGQVRKGTRADIDARGSRHRARR